MTPKQHFRALQIRLEIAEFGMGMPLDRERVKELREQVEQARMVSIGTAARATPMRRATRAGRHGLKSRSSSDDMEARCPRLLDSPAILHSPSPAK